MVEIILLVPVLVCFLIATLSGLMIYYDAVNRGSKSPKKWAIGSVTVPIIILVYIIKRKKIGDRNSNVNQKERIVGTILVASILNLIISIGLSPPDPFTISYNTIYFYPFSILIGHIIIRISIENSNHPVK